MTENQAHKILKFLGKKCKNSEIGLKVIHESDYVFCIKQPSAIGDIHLTWLWNDLTDAPICRYQHKPKYVDVLNDLLKECEKCSISDSSLNIFLKKGTTLEQLLVEMELKNSIE